ncbi:hypothetical protein ACLOJK_015874 [Asimina triloba]
MQLTPHRWETADDDDGALVHPRRGGIRKNKARAMADSDETLELAVSLPKGPRGQKRVHEQSTTQAEMRSHAPSSQSRKVWKKLKTNTSSTKSKGASGNGRLSHSGNKIKQRNFDKKQQDGRNVMNKNWRKVMGDENVRASKNTASSKFHEKQQNGGIVQKRLRKGKGDDEYVKRVSKTTASLKFRSLKKGKAKPHQRPKFAFVRSTMWKTVLHDESFLEKKEPPTSQTPLHGIYIKCFEFPED